MDTWQEIRLAAREHHARVLSESNGDRRAAAMCAAALKLDDLQLAYYRPGTRAGDGVFGFLDRPSLIVHVAEGQDPKEEALVVAHEIGHLKLHRDASQDVTMLSPGLGGDQIEAGSAKAQGYSPRERKEVQADVFAGEFLCPADWMRDQNSGAGTQAIRDRHRLGTARKPCHQSSGARSAVAAPACACTRCRCACSRTKILASWKRRAGMAAPCW